MFRRACGRSSLSAQSSLNFGAISSSGGSSVVISPSALRAAITPTLVASPFSNQQIRGAWWNDALSMKPNRQSDPHPEQEMPEIFANQPEDIDDYIRPDKTVFEKMEDWWDYMYNFFSPSEICADQMMSMHNTGILFGATGPLAWPVVLFLWGTCMRMCTLPINLYVARNAARLALIQGPMADIKQQMEAAKKDKTISSADKKIITEGIKRKKRAIEKKADASLWKSGLVITASPFLVSSFVAIRTLCTYEETLETEGFLWIPDLTCADPLVILPTACLGLFIANMEATMAVNSSGRSNMAVYIKYGARIGGVMFLYFVLQHQPAAMFSYWIGMSLVGLFNPWLQTNERFRKFWKFPPRAQSAIEKEKDNLLYKVMLKMGLRSEILSENVKARASGSAKPGTAAQKSDYQSIHDFEVLEEDDAKTVRAMKSGAKVLNATK